MSRGAIPPAKARNIMSFCRTIRELYGAHGEAWLADLPALLARCARRWSLEIAPPFPNLSYNYVAPARRADGVELVLKAGPPNPEMFTEIAALRCYGGRGIVRLLDADTDWGVLLLERLRPGTPLTGVTDDEAATRIAADVMRQLWQPPLPDHTFPTTMKWGAGLARLRNTFAGGPGPFPADLVAFAESWYAEMAVAADLPVLLHGDLHHDNILRARRQPWLALDPKGVVGEPAYEVGALLRNPLPRLLAYPRPRRVLARRVDLLAEFFSFAREKIVGWGIAQAVLSAWWSYEDHGHGWESAVAVAQLLRDVSVRHT